MTDRIQVVTDGKLPDDPEVLAILTPSQANIDAMWREGNHAMAFDLLLSKIGGAALLPLVKAGFDLSPAWKGRTPAEMMQAGSDWPAILDVVLNFSPAPSDANLGAAIDALGYTARLQEAYGTLDERDAQRMFVWASMMAAGAGEAAVRLGVNLADDLPTSANSTADISEFQRANQRRKSELQTRWKEPAIDYLRAVMTKNPTLSNDDCAEKLRAAPTDAAAKIAAAGGLPSSFRYLSDWIGQERRNERLPAKKTD